MPPPGVSGVRCRHAARRPGATESRSAGSHVAYVRLMTVLVASVDRRGWLALLAATAVTVVGLLAIWLDAVPRDVVCPAIYPAPEECTPEVRRAAARAWSVVLAAAYVVTAAVFLVGRWRRRELVPLVVLVVVGLVGYQAVLGSTGYILW